MVISKMVDPIEKKPLYHFEPGTDTYSIATAGCNLSCQHCQNWSISQIHLHNSLLSNVPGTFMSPQEIVLRAQMEKCSSISFTYTEPTIWFEFVKDVGIAAHKEGLSIVLVTNGTITDEALMELIPYVDAYRVDIKAFSDTFYQDVCKAPLGTLRKVLSSCKLAFDSGLHVEIVYLVIPDKNDSHDQIADLCDWVMSMLSPAVPVHFTRYHPDYRMQIPATPVSTLEAAYQIARDHGILYPYIGNVPGHRYEHTYCPNCEKKVIARDRFQSKVLLTDGCCPVCGYRVLIS